MFFATTIRILLLFAIAITLSHEYVPVKTVAVKSSILQQEFANGTHISHNYSRVYHHSKPAQDGHHRSYYGQSRTGDTDDVENLNRSELDDLTRSSTSTVSRNHVQKVGKSYRRPFGETTDGDAYLTHVEALPTANSRVLHEQMSYGKRIEQKAYDGEEEDLTTTTESAVNDNIQAQRSTKWRNGLWQQQTFNYNRHPAEGESVTTTESISAQPSGSRYVVRQDSNRGVHRDGASTNQQMKVIYVTRQRKQSAVVDSRAYEKCPAGATGQFVYELSCAQFLNCWKGRGIVQNCSPGTLFNPETLECDYAAKVRCVSGPRLMKLERNEIDDDDDVETTARATACPRSFTGIVPHYGDCSKFVNCHDGVEHAMDCAPGTLFDVKTNTCDYPHKAECVHSALMDARAPPRRDAPICTEPSTKRPYANDCAKFIFCSVDLVATVYNCPQGKYYNAETKSCSFDDVRECRGAGGYGSRAHQAQNASRTGSGAQRETSNDLLLQTGYTTDARVVRFCMGKDGFFAHPMSCQHYVKCFNGVPFIVRCKDGTQFDRGARKCSPRATCSTYDQSASGDGESTTLHVDASFCYFKSGVYAHPTSCEHYVRCANNQMVRLSKCDAGKLFHPIAKTCDYNVQCSRAGNSQLSSSSSSSAAESHYVRGTTNASLYNLPATWCKAKQGYHLHPLSCEHYVRCDSGRGKVYRCDAGKLFNPAYNMCDPHVICHLSPNYNHHRRHVQSATASSSSTAGLHKRKPKATCTANGLYAHPKSCEHFVQCLNGKPSVFKCFDGTRFDPEKRHCTKDYPCKSHDQDRLFRQYCTGKSGLQPHPYSCEHYVKCDNGNWHIIKCSVGKLFNAQFRICDTGVQCRLPDSHSYGWNVDGGQSGIRGGSAGVHTGESGQTGIHGGQTGIHGGQTGFHEGHSGIYGGQTGTHTGQTGIHEGHSGIHGGQTGFHEGHSGIYGGQTGTHTEQTGVYTGQSGIHRQTGFHGGQTGTHTGQTGTYTGQTGTYTGQTGTYTGQTGTHTGQTGTYTAQTGVYRGQTEIHEQQTGFHGGQAVLYEGQTGIHGGQSGFRGEQTGTHTGHAGVYTEQTGIYAGQTGAHTGQTGTGIHGGRSGTHTGHTGVYTEQTGIYAGQTGAHTGQTGIHGGRTGTHTGHTGVYTGQSVIHRQSGIYGGQTGTGMHGAQTGQTGTGKTGDWDQTAEPDSSSQHQSEPFTNRSPKCAPHATGLFPHPTDCAKFLNCNNGGTFVQDCGPGTVFNPDAKVCDWPYKVKCNQRPTGSLTQSVHTNRTESHGNQHHHVGQHASGHNFNQQSSQWNHGSGFHHHHEHHPHGQHHHQHDPHGQHHHPHVGQESDLNSHRHEDRLDWTHYHGQHPQQNVDAMATIDSSPEYELDVTEWNDLEQSQTTDSNVFRADWNENQSDEDQRYFDDVQQVYWQNYNQSLYQERQNEFAASQRGYETKRDNFARNFGRYGQQSKRDYELNYYVGTTDQKWTPATDVDADYIFEYENGDDMDVDGTAGSGGAFAGWATASSSVNKRKTCEQFDFHCDDDDECTAPASTCDGHRDCGNGADEDGCRHVLEEFAVDVNQKLAVAEAVKYQNVTVEACAKLCKQSSAFVCKSFNYRRIDSTCFLTASNVGLCGALIILPNYNYYERKSQSIDCSDKFVCGNRKCINRNQVCDGINDCDDRIDEKSCKAEDIGYRIKLAGSTNKHEGRIEVSVFGKSGYVCDDRFTAANADVVCKELGYKDGAIEVKRNSFYANDLTDTGAVQFLMANVACAGNETSIKDCDFNGWGIHECKDKEIVGVVCKTKKKGCQENFWQCDTVNECIPFQFLCDNVADCSDGSDEGVQHCEAPIEMRLIGGRAKNEGRVEVRYHGAWGTVCDDDFNDDAAKVACTYFGYRGTARVVKGGKYGEGTGPIWLDQVYCAGNETSLADCSHLDWCESNCEHNEDVGVVCSDTKEPIEVERARVQDTVEDTLPDQCGVRKDSIFNDENGDVHFRVVRGSVAKRGDYPWQASIKVLQKNRRSHWCGAVVLSSHWILTAAHCLDGHHKSHYVVVAGDYDVNIPEGTEQEAFVEDFYVHERFRDKTKMNNDIALIKLKGRGFALTGDVMAVCLPHSVPNETEENLNCTISGYGSIEGGNSRPSSKLLSGWVPIQSRDVCRMAHVYGKAVTDGMICAGNLNEGVDACDGDSGGPLTCLRDGYYTLYGITSWGQRCGVANKPGVYTRVSYYRKWIEGIMKRHA